MWAAAACAALVCSGCSFDRPAEHRAAPPASASPHVSRHRAGSDLPPLLTMPPPASVQAPVPPRLTPSARAFVAGVNGFCRGYYVDQRRAEERYPRPSGFHRENVLLMREDHRLLRRLERLQPPPALSAVFDQFVANERRLGAGRTEEASQDPTVRAEGTTEITGDIVLRHGYAMRLGTRECDGVLPPDQWVEAVRATQRFDLASDAHRACVGLVDPGFLPSRYSTSRDELAACVGEFRGHRAEDPTPRNIRVTDVSGVEDLSATVHFREVPDCGCGNLVVVLYRNQGRWLVRDANVE